MKKAPARWPGQGGDKAQQEDRRSPYPTEHQDQDRCDYMVRLRPQPRIDAVHALRGALKLLLRRFGLQAVSIEAIPSIEDHPGE
jgi:hypothetical protein